MPVRSADVSMTMTFSTDAQPHQRTAAQMHTSTPALVQRTQGSYKQYNTGDGEAAPETDYDTPAASRYPCPVRQGDLRDLAGQPGQRPWRSSYRTFLGGDQPRCAPGDTETAATMVRRLREAQAHGGYTRNERNRLARMLRIWQARVEGRDPRFLVAGTRAGRLTLPEAGRVAELRRVVGMETWGGPAEREAQPTACDRVLS